ncbi:selenocysteine lyase/cysteine desulfurase [Mucilaginibacter frigoritolerans]|jgi:cysteine desulfurase / selenocysteine lyase|uniref:Selenocysteine lyase/cysteine desulfurase n=1 Tax=Mucilaginibacter frigoritolerans TaxID=652788 RepID=A0A562U5P5_9SPHI|nr:aminotransferase class V-fold PLP-dependent enzyme [Mucilaginibacter frigoritolerans]TWJ00695.1 selenocysteine lyase/cysteine desulfurase [Mucilaginibacter frigoritolerans]
MQIKSITDQEVQQYRAETRGTTQRIHFNNAGSSLPPDVVVDTVVNYLKEEAIYGGYETEAKYKEQLNNTYSLIARLINADKDEIALVENASSAWGIAFNGIEFKPGDEVIISEMEYVTNIIGFLNAEKTRGIKTRIVYNDEQGNFDLKTLVEAISAKTKLIAVTHIASTTGGVMPVVEIGKIARKHNILYLVDACQSVGQVPVDVKEIDCDMLSVTGRKYLRAPRGTGFLYVRKHILDKIKLSFIDGFAVKSVSQDEFKLKDDARRFELYEKNRAITLGLGKAVEYALNIGVDRIWHRVQQLAILMRRHLNNIDGVTVHDIGDQQCGIVTFSVSGFEAVAIKNKLAEKQINVSVGLAQSTLIYMDKYHLTSVVRASVHYYNTEEEILLMCNELTLLLKTVASEVYPK